MCDKQNNNVEIIIQTGNVNKSVIKYLTKFNLFLMIVWNENLHKSLPYKDMHFYYYLPKCTAAIKQFFDIHNFKMPMLIKK